MVEASVTPLVSVIIPTYNRAHILPRALESVFLQELKDLEVVIVDDGSVDDTARVVRDLADPRLVYHPLDRNRGIGAARREGVSRARGGLLAFLDSDDLWKPAKLTRMVEAFERFPEVDLVFSDYEEINYIQNIRDHGFGLARELFEALDSAPQGDGWFVVRKGAPEVLMRGNFVGTSSVVALRRRLFDRVGSFRADLSGPEDLEFWWRSAVMGAQFAYTTEILVERHKDSGSITARKRAFAPQRLRALDACEETARGLGRTDLFDSVNGARLSTWCDLIEACGREGRRLEATRAFVASLRYGLSASALRHYAVALAGPTLAGLVRRWRG
jgi:glycosyltransferase involved in cell wall biosynthesis